MAQFFEAVLPGSPLPPKIQTQSSTDPRFEVREDSRSLAEAEVAAPSHDVWLQLLDQLSQTEPPCPACHVSDPPLEFVESLWRDAPLAPVIRDAEPEKLALFVLDVDIRTFFDSVDHGWLMRMLAHRIADPRVLRLIERWLEAGVLESGQWKAVEAGRHAARVGDQPDPRQCVPPLRRRPLGPPVAKTSGSRAGDRLQVCGRYGPRLPVRGGWEATPRGPQGQAGAVRPVASRGQDPAGRVRAVRRPQPSRRWAATPGDVRLSRLQCAAETWKGVLHERLEPNPIILYRPDNHRI